MTNSETSSLDLATATNAGTHPEPACNNAKLKPRRRMARQAEDQPEVTPENTSRKTAAPSKLDQIQTLLCAPDGASIAELMAATGWQAHSIRGAIAGSLKKRGLVMTSERIDGARHYRAGLPA